MASSSKPQTEDSEADLFDPPRDLICPITQSLFIDPVVNSVGQIYERQAFLEYLERSPEKLDPNTRQKIDENVLTSIYAVKARASEYRETTSRKCIDLASHADAATAVKYLRRAAELCKEADIQVPGLSRPTISQILRQSNNDGYTVGILMSFAEDLMKEGFRNRAASVYHKLLKVGEGEDIIQQPDLLKCCIDCWAGQANDPQREEVSLDKLLDFVENQNAFTWGEIVDIMHKSAVDENLILCLCEALLLKGGDDPALWKLQKDVVMKYVQIRCERLESQQENAMKDIKVLTEWKERTLKAGGVRQRTSIPLSILKERRKPFFLKKRFIASVLICALELVDGGNLAAKVSRAAALLYLVNC